METESSPEGLPVAEDAAPAAAEGGELDIATLPQQAQDYIHELREESKTRRQEHAPYRDAFSHFNQTEQEYLINMVNSLGTPETEQVGAQAMHDLSGRMLGINQEAAEVAADPEVKEAAVQAGLTQEQVQELIDVERNQSQAIAAVEAEAAKLGFQPGTEEIGILWDIALALKENDLSKVAPLVHQRMGTVAAEAEPAAEPIVEPAVTFPATSTPASSGSDTNHEEAESIPTIKSQAMRDRVQRRIEAAAGQ